MKNASIGLFIFALLCFTVRPLYGQETNGEDLAKDTQNPVSDLISVPFQNNINFDVGPDDKIQNVLNIQPVWPSSLNEDWKLITRTILPVTSQPELVPGDGRTFGLGDINFSAFLAPAKASKLLWGAGPVFIFPTATDEVLGEEKWGIGPSAVGLTIEGHWVYGALINNIWSFAGEDDRPGINRMLLQPFLNYNLPNGLYLTTSPMITANWQADDSDDRWTIPIGGGVGKIFRLGKLPLNAQFHGYYNVVSPDFGPDWSIRVQLQFLFPK